MEPIYPLLILLVEEKASNVDLFRKALAHRHNPANLLVVRDGLEARECLLNEGRFALCAQPDVLLLGLGVERPDVRGLLRSLLHDKELRDTRVVALSADPLPGPEERLPPGAYAILPRPDDLDGFCSLVDRIQSICNARPEGPRPPARPEFSLEG